MIEAPEWEHAYNSPTTPNTLLEVRSRDLSPSTSVNMSITNTINRGQGIPTIPNFVPTVPLANTMAGADIKLPIFNGNGLEYPDKHCFLCDDVWTVRQIQDENIKKAQMITTLRGHALDWYMKFSIVPVGVVLKTLKEI